MYPRLHLFEIFLRNAINEKLCDHFNDPDWIVTQTGPSGFMSDNSLGGARHGKPFYLRSEVNSAIRKLQRGNSSIPPSPKVIADLTLGFWVSFLLPHHHRLLNGCLIDCFSHRRPTDTRESIHGALLRIRNFRNRIHHNEPIVGVTMADYTNAISISQEIQFVSSWIDPELGRIIETYPIELA